MPPNCSVTWISYAGDEGGIVCRVEADIEKTEAVFASITHLRSDPRLPLSREITAYQKSTGSSACAGTRRSRDNILANAQDVGPATLTSTVPISQRLPRKTRLASR